MEGSTNVQKLINKFERMTQVNLAPAEPRVRSKSISMMTTEPKSDNSLVKKMIERMNTQPLCATSEPKQSTLHIAKAAEPKEPAEEKVNSPVDTFSKAVNYKTLTIDTLDEDDSYSNFKSTYYSTAPPSPSACSTASTGSIDSIYSSLDFYLPELHHASREISAGVSKIVKPIVYRSRTSTPSKTLQRVQDATLTSRVPNQRIASTNKALSTKTTESSIPVPKPKRGSSQSLRSAVIPSPSNRTPPSSSSTPRYMNYDKSARFAATKAWNLERRRMLEERNRNLAARKVQLPSSKTPRKPRTPECRGGMNQVHYDVNQHKAKPDLAASRRPSTPIHTHV